MNRVNLGWKDIPQRAEDNYKELTTNGYVRWPPQCNPMDLRDPPNNFWSAFDSVQLKDKWKSQTSQRKQVIVVSERQEKQQRQFAWKGQPKQPWWKNWRKIK